MGRIILADDIESEELAPYRDTAELELKIGGFSWRRARK